MKVHEQAAANAFAAVAVIWYFACVALANVAPDLLLTLYQPWFHRLDITKIWIDNPPSVASMLIGLVTLAITAWVSGYIAASAYNRFVKGK